MHILSVYIFQVGDNQQLYARAHWCWIWGLRAGTAVKSHQAELAWQLMINHLWVTINSAVKNCSAETSTDFRIKGNFVATSRCYSMALH